MMKICDKVLTTAMALILAGMFIGAFYWSVVKPYTGYLRRIDSAVNVEAEVSRVVVHTDSDDDEWYKIYVTYFYGNESYEDIYWETRPNEDFYQGEKTIIRIDSQNPEYILKTDLGGRSFIFYLCVFAVVIAALIYESHFYKVRYNEDKKPITSRMIADNLSPRYIVATANAFFFSVAGCVGGKVFMPVLFPGTTFIKFMTASGMVFLVIALCFIFRISRNGYKIGIHSCIIRRSESDGDSTSYYTVFEGLEDAVREAKVYKRTREGFDYYLVMNKKNKVCEVYNTADWMLATDEKSLCGQEGFVILRLFSELLAGSAAMFCIVGFLALIIHKIIL